MSFNKEVERVTNHLARCPGARTTTPTKALTQILLQYDGMLMACGRNHDIRSRRIGPGVHEVYLVERNGR